MVNQLNSASRTMGCKERIQKIAAMSPRNAAQLVKQSPNSETMLNDLLDRILSPEIPIDDSKSIEWILLLIAGGNTFEEFAAQVKVYHVYSKCGLLWRPDEFVYRCRTCCVSPFMSLCTDCFSKGQHDGHDFQIFRSQTGGTCDCGDEAAMLSSGFCSFHHENRAKKVEIPPPGLLTIAKLIAPRIFCRLILHLRHLPNQRRLASNGEIPLGADNFFTMLGKLTDMGTAMRRVLTSALANADTYRKLIRDWPRDDPKYAAYMNRSEDLYKEVTSILKNPEPPPEFENCPGLQIDLTHKNFLEEILFWTVWYEFPGKLNDFILTMFSESSCKEAVVEAYVLHYSRIATMLLQVANSDPLSERISKLSVQWFSNVDLAQKMAEDFFLPQVLVVNLKHTFDSILIPDSDSSPESASESKHLVVNCKSWVISQSRYWLFISDLNSVLRFESVALKLMNDESLLKTLFSFLSYFQGMNVKEKRYDEHIECDERNTDDQSIAELQNASLILPLLVHLKDGATVFLTKRLLTHCLVVVERWLQSARTDELLGDRISFHIPLHRLLAILIIHAVNVQNVQLSDVMPPDNLIRLLLPYPLHIQAVFREIINGLWVRNGEQLKKHAVSYTHADFYCTFIDADVSFLQIFGAKLPPNEVMKATIKEFKVNEWFQLNKSIVAEDRKNEEDAAATVEGFLEFWAILCVNRTNLGNSHRQNLKNDLVSLLCTADQSHSCLMNRIPDKMANKKPPEFDAILEEISDYEPPSFQQSGGMQQGIYRPKASVWNELYDPLHTILRMGTNRLEAQDAANRFIEHLKKNKLSSSAKTVWRAYRMPVTCEKFRDPRCMLNGRIFHALVWIVLYKYVHDDNIRENVLSLTIYLLELAASVAAKEISGTDQTQAEPIDVTDLELENWFSSDVLTKNVRTEIRRVRYISNGETNAIEVNESIVSLLLKCYSKIGLNTVFNIDNQDVFALENRIGDDAAFVEKTLIRIVLLSDTCRKTVQDCHEKVYSTLSSSPSIAERDRKRLALERQRRIMETLAEQRDRFVKENEKMLSEDKMDWEPSETSESEPNRNQNEKPTCSICRNILNSTTKNPIMLLTRVELTSVLGHRKSPAGVSFAKQHREEITLLSEEFSDWCDSVTFGYEDGVYVQSCGHLFDYACLKHMLEKEELVCPVCRQTANNVIPIIPNDISAQSKSTEKESISDFNQAVAVISGYVEQKQSAGDAFFKGIVDKSLEKFRDCFDNAGLAHFNMSEHSPCSLLFLMSVARCNLEMELLLRGNSLVVLPNPKDTFLVTNKSCTLPLLRFLRIGTQKVKREAALKLWKQLVGSSSNKRKRKCIVPILLRDPIAVLLHLILILPFNFQQAHFRWIVKLLYRLVNFQAAIRLSYHLTKERRDYFRRGRDETNTNEKIWCYDTVMRKTLEMLDYVIEGKMSTQEVQPKFPDLSLPFLRVASILQSHMYEDQLPEMVNADEEHQTLLAYLQLTDEISLTESGLITAWFSELRNAMKNTRSSKVPIYKMLSSGSLDVWCPPKLIPLPYQFNHLFLDYKDKPCSQCKQKNDKNSLCLVCGVLVCLTGRCRSHNSILESVRHANECGAGTTIYLNVSLSNVVVVRKCAGRKWGSMYLNAYGEEDPDLKRGDPLFLSNERYHRLEREWLSHSFNRLFDT